MIEGQEKGENLDKNFESFGINLIIGSEDSESMYIHNINESFLDMAKNFFQHYKDLEGEKVKIGNWLPRAKAKEVIQQSIDRGPFVDQTQSMNLFFEEPTANDITKALFFGWANGLKTGCYYIRTQSKTSAQKFTIDESKIKDVQDKYGVCESCSG